jgi:hypothetical protein
MEVVVAQNYNLHFGCLYVLNHLVTYNGGVYVAMCSIIFPRQTELRNNHISEK